MQDPLADPQVARRLRISALQDAHSGGLRINADFAAEVEEAGTG